MNIIPVNGSDRGWTKHNYVLAFGAYGDTVLRVWANGLENAFDIAFDWLADNKPGKFFDEAVTEEYERAISEGLSEEEAIERAELDMTRAGDAGHYLPSWECQIVAENPTREEVLRLQGRAA